MVENRFRSLDHCYRIRRANNFRGDVNYLVINEIKFSIFFG